MKIVLSRKGFDSANGGMPSPIVDGQLLSMPIPVLGDERGRHYSDLTFRDVSYLTVLNQLRKKGFHDSCCHLDPDIRDDLHLDEHWEPAFGQVGGAQTHLHNQGVSIGDLFLFFGWFRDTKINRDGALKYHDADRHVIYGYLQIGEILQGEKIRARCPWHPHADALYSDESNNTLYLPTNKLSFDGVMTAMPGYGLLPFDVRRVLTKAGESRSRWALLPWMEKVQISHHSKASLKADYFKSADIGQEFVIEPNPDVTAWAQGILVCD